MFYYILIVNMYILKLLSDFINSVNETKLINAVNASIMYKIKRKSTS
jgi:hypothetical protein